MSIAYLLYVSRLQLGRVQSEEQKMFYHPSDPKWRSAEMSLEKLEESGPSLGKNVNKIGFLGEAQVGFACTRRKMRLACLDQQVASCQIPDDSD